MTARPMTTGDLGCSIPSIEYANFEDFTKACLKRLGSQVGISYGELALELETAAYSSSAMHFAFLADEERKKRAARGLPEISYVDPRIDPWLLPREMLWGDLYSEVFRIAPGVFFVPIRARR